MRAILLGTTVAVVAFGAVLSPIAGVLAAQPAPAVSAAPAQRLSLPAPKPGHAKPIVAVVAGRPGAEVTDFIVPYGVLGESGLFDVRALSTTAGPVQLFRSLSIRPDQTVAEFDARTPEGADIVIVPAQMNPKDPALQAWIKAQAAKGATIVSICEGARVVAAAGLLDGKQATTHWAALADLEKHYPRTTWVRDRRYLQDGAVISTTGVAASVPVSLALIEAAGGQAAAGATAARIGVRDWSAAHRTADFRLSKLDFARAAAAFVAPWTHETVEVPVTDGEDEISLALRADAWTRSYRTKVVVTNAHATQVRSAHGLTLVVDDRPRSGRFVMPARRLPAVAQLDATLSDMGQRYGALAVRLAKVSMEYVPASPPG